MVLPAGLRAFHHRDFRLFWSGQLVSLVGTWMQSVGQVWIVLELTGSPFKLGVISALQFGPMLFLSLLAGALADRVRKRRLLLLTQSALMFQALALAALDWTGQSQYWHVAVLAAVYGVANTLDLPARQSFVVELVGKSDLMNAIALNATVFNGARIVGPAVAGLLVARRAHPGSALRHQPVRPQLQRARAAGGPRRPARGRARLRASHGLARSG